MFDYTLSEVTDAIERAEKRGYDKGRKTGLEEAARCLLDMTKMRAGGCSVSSENERRAVEQRGKQVADFLRKKIELVEKD